QDASRPDDEGDPPSRELAEPREHLLREGLKFLLPEPRTEPEEGEEAADPERDADDVDRVRDGTREAPRGGRGVRPAGAGEDRRDPEGHREKELDGAGRRERGRGPPGGEPQGDEEREAEPEAGGGRGEEGGPREAAEIGGREQDEGVHPEGRGPADEEDGSVQAPRRTSGDRPRRCSSAGHRRGCRSRP